MTWDAYNRRKTALREILTIADRERDIELGQLLTRVDPRHEAFDDTDALLIELQMAWFQRLTGQIDRMGDGADTPEMVAVAAWTAAAADMPGARTLLDRHLEAPVLTKALAKERAYIAASAGVPMNHPDSHEHGERIISSARDQAVYPEVVDATDDAPVSLFARLKSAIAA